MESAPSDSTGISKLTSSTLSDVPAEVEGIAEDLHRRLFWPESVPDSFANFSGTSMFVPAAKLTEHLALPCFMTAKSIS